ncbi:lysophospholipid acyltransferase family protein [Streptomyces sp. VRA16 Mangrove soil]|uniref:lysophospholipid acyltransferase family protein n=1 Tax=Streptomyces sp. VRA16 Mangrove soil TaxID=2817434 RepID=UPI001A9E299D|nr:lysophospholipid acyltransferase family protein [Streptomyces sp. VRA16 Mangrove soil]MBO1331443.1 acyltransferase family protein [Streptomyces sp. VRA16 Mangrove soil]
MTWESDLADTLLGLLADDYFRVEVSGTEHIPRTGPALLAANHSGAWGLDGFVLHKVLLRQLGRPVRVYASELVLRTPVLAAYARDHGVVTDDPTLGRDLLAAGELVALFPEGFAGVGKDFSQRYRLRPFGPGFATTAVLTGAPVVPVSIVGAEETYPKLGEIGALARRFGLPYFPVTTPVPLPAKWYISVGEPIHAPAAARTASFAERSAATRRLCDEVWFTVQGMVDRDRERRTTPFW